MNSNQHISESEKSGQIKVAFVITGLSTGGAETMLLKLIQHIDRERFIPIVISLIDKGTIGSKIEALGIPVYILGMRRYAPNPLLVFSLAKLLRDFSPDIVHTWMYHADLLGGIAARLAGCRKIIWCIRHSNLSKRENKFTTLLIARICAVLSYRLPNRILSCSKNALEVHADLGYRSDIMAVIPNGFELDKFRINAKKCREIRESLGIPSDCYVVGLVARFDPQKNHLGFVDCAAAIVKDIPNVRFVLAGFGVDSSNTVLVSKIEANDLVNKFILLGRQDDMPALMASFDVLASSSHGEAFPNVLGEAMACEVPCVVTDVGDSADIVGDTGRVVAAGDMIGLANGIIQILNLPGELKHKLGVAARAKVVDRYDIKRVVAQYQSAYLSVEMES